jgi:hypothetical protein
MDREEIDIRLGKLIAELLNIAEESISTVKLQIEEMRKEEPYTVAPPDDLVKIATVIQKINDIKKGL